MARVRWSTAGLYFKDGAGHRQVTLRWYDDDDVERIWIGPVKRYPLRGRVRSGRELALNRSAANEAADEITPDSTDGNGSIKRRPALGSR